MQSCCRPLLLQERTGALRHLADEEAHLRLGGLVIRLQSINSEAFRRAWSDGTDDRRAKAFVKRLRITHPFCHKKQMRNLPRIHEEHNIDVPVCESEDSLAQWLNILRQRPLIDEKARDGDAFLGERREQFRIGGAVLLNGNVHALERGANLCLESRHQRAPCERLGCDYGDWDSKLTERGGGFWPTGRNFDGSKRREEFLAVIVLGNNFDEGADADSGGEDDQVECASHQGLCIFENRLIGFERNLA